ncbi:uncharacterized protein TRIADDRAFT_29001, partial [Trichoplax adhaerens]
LNSDLPFLSGNPNVEVTEGIIHLFKENQMTSLEENVLRSEMLCMLAVPATMSCNDLIQFAAPYSPNIEHIKIIRDSTPNEYMVLIKFKDQTCSDEFFKLYNGRTYHSLEDKICHLVYVSLVETMTSTEGASFPIPGLTELPNCPVCLERMDESVEGILTILCNHTFHINCLTQWGDSSCPVCRYCQSPEVETESICFECDDQNDLWICMICGNIGCGRYSAGHAYSHFQSTEHAYAMKLDNNRVWDYTGDNYVHRLVQNKSDGKPVAISNNDADDEDKRDSLALEFTYLLTQQLESQRRYYESKILSLEGETAKKLSLREEEVQLLKKSMSVLQQEHTSTVQQRQNLENKSLSIGNKLKKLAKELDEEKEMNKCMRDNQAQLMERLQSSDENWKKKEKEHLQKINDLQDQLRDVMFYLDAQKKVSQSPAEAQKDIQDGNISVGAAGCSATSASNPSHARKSRKKRK